jgi:hypothetical protein
MFDAEGGASECTMVDSPEVTTSPVTLDPRVIDTLLAELNPE